MKKPMKKEAMADKAADKATGMMPAASDDRWKMEDGMRDMMRAEVVKGDKNLMGKIAEHAKAVHKTAAKCAK